MITLPGESPGFLGHGGRGESDANGESGGSVQSGRSAVCGGGGRMIAALEAEFSHREFLAGTTAALVALIR